MRIVTLKSSPLVCCTSLDAIGLALRWRHAPNGVQRALLLERLEQIHSRFHFAAADAEIGLTSVHLSREIMQRRIEAGARAIVRMDSGAQ